MRIIAIAVATSCALVAITPADAQQVNKIKATGANAAGACAGALDMMGQYISRADNPDQKKLLEVQTGRDFFADLPRYPKSEITAAAQAFVVFMSNRIRNAKTPEEQHEIEREIITISKGCVASAQADGVARQRLENQTPGTITPAQPSVTQPYQTVPAQPYTTQPLLLNPLPAQ